VVAFFLRYYPFKAHIIFCKSKKYMLFSKRCGSFLKKKQPLKLVHFYPVLTFILLVEQLKLQD
jgi:hypothetical protein